MSAFARGMQLGQSAWDAAEDARVRREELGLRKEADRRAAETHALQTDASRRAASRENQLTGLRTQMADYANGVDRGATNSALDADFEAASQAALRGQALPAMQGGSNAANEAALTVRNPVDISSPKFQQGMAGLRAQYALAAGDMKDFDAVQAGERTRAAGASDSEFALRIMQNPNGPEAKQARVFINDQSKRFSIDPPDPKTGMSTIRVIKGDRTTPVNVSPSDLGKIAVGYNRLQRGDVGGLDVISSVNKSLADALKDELKLDLDVTRTNNDAAYKTGALANDRARTSASLATAARQNMLLDRSIAGQRLAEEAAGLHQGYLTAKGAGAAGKDAMGIYAGLYNNAATRGVGYGLKLPALNARSEVDPTKYFQALNQAAQSGLFKTPQEAQMAVDQQFGISSGPDVGAVAEQLRALDQGRARPSASQPSAGAPAPMRPRITTIVPPRSAAEMRAPVSTPIIPQESDAEFLSRYLR